MSYVSVGGVRIHYRHHAGSSHPAPPPLLLVHGAGGDSMQWPGELRRLPGFEVCAVDLPGHGGSAGVGAGTVSAYAEFVRDFADALAWPRFRLVGHSMGGAIGLEVALRYRERLAGLVLVATGAQLRVSPRLISGVQDDFMGTAALLTRWAHGQEIDTNLSRLYLRRLREVAPQLLLADFVACDSFDRSGQLANIATPTLILCGAADRMTPPELSHELAQGIAGSRLTLFPDAGHMVMLEQPGPVAREITGFLRDLAVDGDGELPGYPNASPLWRGRRGST